MAVALRREEFEFDTLSLIRTGMLTSAFAATKPMGEAQNDPVFEPLRLVVNNTPTADENGVRLDTTERVQSYLVGDQPFIEARHSAAKNFEYNRDDLEIEPAATKGSGPNDADFSTNAGYMKQVVSSTAHDEAEKKKREEQWQYLMLLENTRRDGEYLAELNARIAELDKRIAESDRKIEQMTAEMQETKNELSSIDQDSSLTPEEKRRKKMGIAVRNGLKEEDLQHLSGEELNRAILEAQRERIEQERRQNEEYKREREEAVRKRDEHIARTNTPNPQMTVADSQELSALKKRRAEYTEQPLSPEVANASTEDMDADSVLSLMMVKVPEKKQSIESTAEKSVPQSVTPTLESAQTASLTLVTSAPSAIQKTSFANQITLESDTSSASALATAHLQEKFFKASNPQVTGTDATVELAEELRPLAIANATPARQMNVFG